MRIKFRLIFAFFLVSTLIAIIGFVSFETTKDSLKKSVGDNSVLLSDEIISQINDQLNNDVTTFQLHFKEPIVQNALIDSNREFAKLENVQEYIDQKDKEWIASKETTPFMNELIESKLSDELRMHQKFYEKKYGYKYFGEIFVTNSYGANVAQTGKTTDYRQDDESWWQIAKTQGVYIGDIQYDDSSDLFARAVSLRIDDSENNFLGVAKHVVNIEKIFNILKNIDSKKKYWSEKITLLDDQNRIIYTTDESYGNLETVFKKQISYNKLIDRNSKNGFYVTKNDIFDSGKLVTYSISDVNGLNTKNWAVVIVYDIDEVFSPITNIQNTVLGFSIFTSILAIFFGIYMSDSISKPITKLKHATNRLAEDSFASFELAESNDEVGSLVKSFKRMSQEIQKKIVMEKELTIARNNIKNERLAAIGELAASLAHDLRNPLAVIKNTLAWIKIINHDKFDESTAEQIDWANDAIERISFNVENVLDYVRNNPLYLEQIELLGIINSAASSVMLEFKTMKFDCNFEQLAIKIIADSDKLRTVFVNIFTNASQAMTDDGNIKVRAYEEGEKIRIEIEDSGPGIPEEIMSKIFDPFFTTKMRGTGLGLISVKGIIEQHGGTVSVRNNPTTFTIILPKVATKYENNDHIKNLPNIV